MAPKSMYAAILPFASLVATTLLFGAEPASQEAAPKPFVLTFSGPFADPHRFPLSDAAKAFGLERLSVANALPKSGDGKLYLVYLDFQKASLWETWRRLDITVTAIDRHGAVHRFTWFGGRDDRPDRPPDRRRAGIVTRLLESGPRIPLNDCEPGSIQELKVEFGRTP